MQAWTPTLPSAFSEIPTGTPFPPTPTPTYTFIPPSLTRTRTQIPPTRTHTPSATTAPAIVTATRVVQVPILMYHRISIPPPDADNTRLDLSVTPESFETQLDYLAIEGYHPIRVQDLADHLISGMPLPDKAIVLTFDDGYADNYENAFPALRNHDFPATVFVIAQFAEENRWGHMSWAQLKEMANAGIEIGSHTLDHPSLRNKPHAYQMNEIVGSKQLISSRLAVPVVSFSYPSGDYDATTLELVRSAGYTSAVTTIQGAKQNSEAIYELRRVRIRGSYSIGDYDKWVKRYMENGK